MTKLIKENNFADASMETNAIQRQQNLKASPKHQAQHFLKILVPNLVHGLEEVSS